MSTDSVRTGGVRGEIKGWHVLVAVVAFFAVVFAVNGVFIYYAVSTHTGLDNTSPYRRGLDYNQRLEAERQQTARGWAAQIALAPAADRLELTLVDKSGFPVPGLLVNATLGRPSTTSFDQALVLKEVDPGRYAAAFSRLDAGGWIVSLEASERTAEGENVVYRMKQRLWLKP